jgi:hypothetical protein
MNINLSKEDLISVITLIDVMSTRGAVKGEELLVIGTMRNKFEKAVKQIEADTVTENDAEKTQETN